jgi:hypothetical protein
MPETPNLLPFFVYDKIKEILNVKSFSFEI